MSQARSRFYTPLHRIISLVLFVVVDAAIVGVVFSLYHSSTSCFSASVAFIRRLCSVPLFLPLEGLETFSDVMLLLLALTNLRYHYRLRMDHENIE